MGVFSDKLYIAVDCGVTDKVMPLVDSFTVETGCFRGTKAEAIAEIRKKYEGQEAEDYIQKVRECFEGADDLPINVRWAVTRQGFELELLRKDHD